MPQYSWITQVFVSKIQNPNCFLWWWTVIQNPGSSGPERSVAGDRDSAIDPDFKLGWLWRERDVDMKGVQCVVGWLHLSCGRIIDYFSNILCKFDNAALTAALSLIETVPSTQTWNWAGCGEKEVCTRRRGWSQGVCGVSDVFACVHVCVCLVCVSDDACVRLCAWVGGYGGYGV